MKSHFLPTLAVLVASIAIVVAVSAPSSQGQFQYTATPIGSWWPPHPRDQVHLYFDGTPTGLTMAPGDEHEMYVVPPDKYFVLMPSGLPYPNNGSGGWALNVSTDSATSIQLFEDKGGSMEARSWTASGVGGFQAMPGAAPGPIGPVGWVFSPGSRVVLKNVNPTDSHVLGLYSVFGFLVDL